jgi:endonuclease/exonuclease/phosphatase family metal-dependent hydrolase
MSNKSRRGFIRGMGAFALTPFLPQPGGAMEGFAETAPDAALTNHRILCCNIRVALDEDEAKGVGWSSRKAICLDIINHKKPDIICLQEVLKVQAADFSKHFSGFSLFGFDGPEMDAHPIGYHGIAKNPILFSKERYELLAAGTYWLSDTPLVAGSMSWNTARARHANWVRLRERKTGRQFRVVNLHLDHVSDLAKINQAKMVVEESSQYLPGFPQILTGDFNSKYNSKVFDSVRSGGWKETYETIHGEGEAGYTGHAFEGEKYEKGSTGGRIDFIWYKGPVKPVAAAIIKDQRGGKYPSDHYFMSSDISFL